jgi:hypothetical protein
MNIINLDGVQSNWKLSGHISKNNKLNKSALHLSCRELIKKLFPTLQLLEEVPVPIRKSETVYLDFYLPLKKICLEVHGEQHYTFNNFFYKDKLSFLKAKKRDNDKKYWCDINGIKYIELPFNETENEWENRIKNEHNG